MSLYSKKNKGRPTAGKHKNYQNKHAETTRLNVSKSKQSDRNITYSLEEQLNLNHPLPTEKRELNIAIISQIPLPRETLKNYLFRVKALLIDNNRDSAFLLVALKIQNLHEEKLLSQIVSLGTDTQNSDEEIPDDNANTDEY
uniref:Uncharacterized protein n=1 Tax=Glossina austeni TaxID=7395 RepID=A0A1A9USJ5_GLOAU